MLSQPRSLDYVFWKMFVFLFFQCMEQSAEGGEIVTWVKEGEDLWNSGCWLIRRHSADEVCWLLLSLVGLLICCKFSFFFPVDIISGVVREMLSWCFHLLGTLCTCQSWWNCLLCAVVARCDFGLNWRSSGRCLVAAAGPAFAEVLCGSSVCQGGAELSHPSGLVHWIGLSGVLVSHKAGACEQLGLQSCFVAPVEHTAPWHVSAVEIVDVVLHTELMGNRKCCVQLCVESSFSL